MSNSEENSDYSDNSSESEDVDTSKKRGVGTQMKNNDDSKKNLSEYEKQRMKTIEDNRARMEALGLKSMAKSLMGSAPKGKKITSEKKGKRKLGRYDDEEYKPAEDDNDDDDDSGDEEVTVSRKDKGKKTIRAPRKPSTKRRVPKRKLDGYPDYVDDDDALMQAIALSLQDSAGFLNVKTQTSQTSAPQVIDISSSDVVNQGNTQIQEDAGKRKKKKKPVTNRVQMTEDEVILHFFQFDEAGKGKISLRDVQRLAAAHDFMWSDKEMADMIRCFDIDGDGKLSLDDFRKIVRRCNLIQAPEKTVIG